MSKQKTIYKEIRIEGRAWLSGEYTWLECFPSENGLTLEFEGETKVLSPKLLNHDETQHIMSLEFSGKIISMVEHFFAALSGLGIDNIHIKFGTVDVPFCASSELFISHLLKVGIREIDKEKVYLTIDREIIIEDGEKICRISPCEDFEVHTQISFNNIIGDQSFAYDRNTNFLSEISPARSFLIFEIAEGINPWENYRNQFSRLPKLFPLDPSLCPLIAFTKNKFLFPLHYENEPARHKTLDFIGDFFILGKLVKGKFSIIKTGHSFHRKIIDEVNRIYLQDQNLM